MSESAEPTDATRPGLRKPLLIGGVAAVLLGAGGWFAVHAGLLGADAANSAPQANVANTAFVPIPAMVINLGPNSRHKHLRFSATLEVPRNQQGFVESLMPRVTDVLNSYLRAIETGTFEEPAALFRLRAQMLRRVQLVTAEDAVRDLLITEFVFN